MVYRRAVLRKLAAHNTFSAGYVRSAACLCSRYPVTVAMKEGQVKRTALR